MSELRTLLEEPMVAPPADAAPMSESDVAAIVPGSAAPPPPTLAYRLSLAFVATVAALLAAFYFALLAAAVVGLVAHVAYDTAIIGAEGGMKLRDYIGILVLCVILIVLLLRPLVARRKSVSDAVTVSRDDEPALHAFVDRVAVAVGAPRPVRVDVDVQVNASASFRRGFRSLFAKHDLVLTIGAPIVAATSVDELASVVAHELGHFRQGAGMRLFFVTRTIGQWFHRVAFERDRWDAALDNVSHAFGGARIASWLTRKLFQLFSAALARAEGLVSRRMEVDADDHSLALVGGPATVRAFRRLVHLDVAHGRAMETTNVAWRGDRLPENLTALQVGWLARMPKDEARAHVDAALQRKTRSASTHPCTRERMERAAPAAVGPLAPRPARSLLRDPDALFRAATARFFAVSTDGASARATLVPASVLLAESDDARAASEALIRWGQRLMGYLALPRIGAWLCGPAPAGAAVDEIRAARADLTAAAGAAYAARDRIDAADTRIVESHRVEAVVDARGATRKMTEVSFDDRTAEGARRVRADAEAAQRGELPAIQAAHDALARRLRACLAVAEGVAVDDARSLASQLAAADESADDVATLRTMLPARGDLLRERDERKNSRASAALDRLLGEMLIVVDRIGDGLRARGGEELAGRVVVDAASDAPLDERLTAPELTVAQFYRWWFDTAARLAVRLEEMERAAGFEPLPAP